MLTDSDNGWQAQSAVSRWKIEVVLEQIEQKIVGRIIYLKDNRNKVRLRKIEGHNVVKNIYHYFVIVDI